jgi:DNA replication and repair protein RecF
MQITSIKTDHYKNHKRTHLKLSPTINIFTGNNGSGKTNLLDALHMICFGRSYFSSRESHIKQIGADFYRIEALIQKKGVQEKVVIKFDGQTKVIEIDDVIIPSLLEFVGRYPVTMICPGDVELIYGGSEIRRKLLDQTLCQTDANYLKALLQYNKVLKQRNAYLKQTPSNRINTILLEPWNHLLQLNGQYIYEARKNFCEAFYPLVLAQYDKLAQQNDGLQMNYQSQIHELPIREGLIQTLEKDVALKRTNFGIHKDDLAIHKDSFQLSKTGSQGQIKSAVLSIKLAQIRYLSDKLGTTPLLLLDDIFDKLDPYRIQNLLRELFEAYNCQVCITDAFKHRLSELCDQIAPGQYQMWWVEAGKVNPIHHE